ncbi:MAG: NAD-dependent epimerase/dehydratase family protein [Candidatus Brocadiia bacterium]
MKCLVTGASGFVGGVLANALLARGDEVVALDKRPYPGDSSPGGLCVVQSDVNDFPTVLAAMRDCAVVFHIAAARSVPGSFSDPMEYFRSNSMGTASVLEAARQAGCRRVVIASSSSVYGDPARLPVREDSPLLPKSPYASSKVCAEMASIAYGRDFGLPVVRLRYFNIYGPRPDREDEYLEVVPRFLLAMGSGKSPEVFGDGSAGRDFIHVEDIVSATILAADAAAAPGNAYNIGSGASLSVSEVISSINRLLGTSIEPRFKPEREGDVHSTHADISAARRDLGYEPQLPFSEGLARTARAYGLLCADDGTLRSFQRNHP